MKIKTKKIHLKFLLRLFALNQVIIFSTTSCSTTSKQIDFNHCDNINLILKNQEINDILKLNEKPFSYAKIRIFYLSEYENCNGVSGEWEYSSFSKMRPSINTGYNRDLFIDIKNNKYGVYVCSYGHYNNRQTTHLFIFENFNNMKFKGRSEYTDN